MTVTRRLAALVAGASDWLGLAAWDAVQNRRWRTAASPERFLVVRHGGRTPHFYDLLLDWLALHFPELRARYELHPLPTIVHDWSRYRLHVPWLQDPVESWSGVAHRLASGLQAECDKRHIPIVNRVDRLPAAGKSEGARRIASAGLRTAKMARITDPRALHDGRLDVPLPLFVREDWGHGGPMVRADSEAELRTIDLSQFVRPVAVELVDVRSDDGLFRKYRYVVAGDLGVPQSMHVDPAWCVRGAHSVFSDALRAEEIAYTRAPLVHHARFVAARQALGLDFVAFDYSLDRTGDIVVWEANPYPYLHFVGGRRRYRQWPTTRVLAAMARLHLERAGLDVPATLDDVIAREQVGAS